MYKIPPGGGGGGSIASSRPIWGIILIFMVRLSFNAIPMLIYDVMNDITMIP